MEEDKKNLGTLEDLWRRKTYAGRAWYWLHPWIYFTNVGTDLSMAYSGIVRDSDLRDVRFRSCNRHRGCPLQGRSCSIPRRSRLHQQ